MDDMKEEKPKKAKVKAKEKVIVNPVYVVAPNKRFSCKKGLMHAGDIVEASNFSGGLSVMEKLVDHGIIVEMK